MNEDKEITSHLTKLPKPIQDFISSGIWEEKVSEISKKYSLNQEQSNSLSNIVLLALTLVIDPNTIKEVIIEDLGTSELLTEQIVDDLNSRVFEYAVKELEKNNEKKVEPKLTSIPEIRPDNTPMVGNSFIPPKPQLQNEALDRQKPSFGSVPRYATNNTGNSVNPLSNNSGNIIANKLNNITPSTKENPPIKYEKDPYREPLG